MTLLDILNNVDVIRITGNDKIIINDINYDSNKIKQGDLFFAIPGKKFDGNDFVSDAIKNGAIGVVSEYGNSQGIDVTWIQVSKIKKTIGIIASNFYNTCNTNLKTIGITGTNGKTTTAYLTFFLLKSILHRAGLIGTVETIINEDSTASTMTTPQSLEVHKIISDMQNDGVKAMSMEVSSHGLDQNRISGVNLNVGVFTNLTQDHLDYHKSMDEYFISKQKLFDEMDKDTSKESTAVINIDDPYGEKIVRKGYKNIKIITYGRSANSDFFISNIRKGLSSTQFSLSFKNRSFLVKIPLIGEFNVYNSVAAIISCYGIGLNLREVIRKIPEIPQVKGRLELIGDKMTLFKVFVDYAHTPDALDNVLKTLKEINPNRIITVFGCGGNRDLSKRPLMGEIAAKRSDICIITSDNPRKEDPLNIIKSIEKGFIGMYSTYEIIEDRQKAIEKAINIAKKNDIVLIAGKGHEDYQEINDTRTYFSDQKEALYFIKKRISS